MCSLARCCAPAIPPPAPAPASSRSVRSKEQGIKSRLLSRVKGTRIWIGRRSEKMSLMIIPATMAERVPDGAGGVEVPLECGRPRNCSPRDDSPSGPGPYERRDRVRDGVPSPQQRAEGHDHVLAPFSLGSPSLHLDSHVSWSRTARRLGQYHPPPLGSRIFSC